MGHSLTSNRPQPHNRANPTSQSSQNPSSARFDSQIATNLASQPRKPLPASQKTEPKGFVLLCATRIHQPQSHNQSPSMAKGKGLLALRIEFQLPTKSFRRRVEVLCVCVSMCESVRERVCMCVRVCECFHLKKTSTTTAATTVRCIPNSALRD